MENKAVVDNVPEEVYANLQNYAEFAIRRLVEVQGCKPAQNNIGCFYRIGNLACIIGGTIPDDVYEPALEDSTVGGLVMSTHDLSYRNSAHLLTRRVSNEFYEWMKSKPVFSQANIKILRELQFLHDNISPNKSREKLKLDILDFLAGAKLNSDFVETLDFSKNI